MFDEMNRLGRRREPFFFLIDFLGTKSIVRRFTEIDPNEIEFSFRRSGLPSVGNETPGIGKRAPVRIARLVPPCRDRYRTAFRTVQRHLVAGNSLLVNLTAPVTIELAARTVPVGLRDVYRSAVARYRIRYRDDWVCFSPETFVTIRDGEIASHPMKGTIRADTPNAEQVILADEKEAAEHLTIVDLIRNDIGRVASRVRVDAYRYIETVRKPAGDILQVSSRIVGRLPADWPARLGEIFREMLPAGSITGAPKTRTVEIIREAEWYDRGFYTGVAGYFDGSSLDSCVLIRFIERTSDGYVFKAGGGVTVYSDPDAEYREILEKTDVPIG